MQVVEVKTQGVQLDYGVARALAKVLAAKLAGDAMLVAWFDGKAQKGWPEVQECARKPGWLAYAESHGGEIRVDVNRDEFVFIFAPGL